MPGTPVSTAHHRTKVLTIYRLATCTDDIMLRVQLNFFGNRVGFKEADVLRKWMVEINGLRMKECFRFAFGLRAGQLPTGC